MRRGWKEWTGATEAAAAIEAGFLFPVLMSILLGIVDIGSALTASQKVTNASHVIADLLTREDEVTDAVLNDATVAGRLVMLPYPTGSFGWDVVGVRFVGAQKTPTQQWRDTANMAENAQAVPGAAGLGDQDEGVVAVTVRYNYDPFFSGFLAGSFPMQETAYARGRRGVFIARDTGG